MTSVPAGVELPGKGRKEKGKVRTKSLRGGRTTEEVQETSHRIARWSRGLGSGSISDRKKPLNVEWQDGRVCARKNEQVCVAHNPAGELWKGRGAEEQLASKAAMQAGEEWRTQRRGGSGETSQKVLGKA